MNNFTSLNTAATVTVGLFLILGISAPSIPASTPENRIEATGTAQDLENLENTSGSEQFWQIGGEAPGNDDNSEIDYQIRKSKLFFDSVEANPPTEPWSNQNAGELKTKTGSIPLIGF